MIRPIEPVSARSLLYQYTYVCISVKIDSQAQCNRASGARFGDHVNNSEHRFHGKSVFFSSGLLKANVYARFPEGQKSRWKRAAGL